MPGVYIKYTKCLIIWNISSPLNPIFSFIITLQIFVTYFKLYVILTVYSIAIGSYLFIIVLTVWVNCPQVDWHFRAFLYGVDNLVVTSCPTGCTTLCYSLFQPHLHSFCRIHSG
jgi:hypothetical protein